MIKEKRRKKKRTKKIFKGILIFLLVAVIAAVIVIKVFVVKNVKVEGNELYDEQLITETVLNDEYSWNSLYVFLKYTFVDTDAVPFIDTMEIKLNNPQTLTIKVYEKGMLGYMYIPAIDENAYFDKDGFVVETSSRIIERVPKVEGIKCNEVVLYEKLPIDSQQLREILTITQTLKREDLGPDVIEYGVTNEPVVHYANVAVSFGSTDLLTQKVTRLHEILPSIVDMTGTLHLESWTEESNNIVFEKTPEEVVEEGTEASDEEEITETEGSSGEETGQSDEPAE